MQDVEVMVVPLAILISLLAPLYALVAGLYVLLFRHSTNEDRHATGDAWDKNTCEGYRTGIHSYIADVDTRAGKAVDAIKADMNRQLDRLFDAVGKLETNKGD